MYYLISYKAQRPLKLNGVLYALYNDVTNTFVTGMNSIQDAVTAIQYSPLDGYLDVHEFMAALIVFEKEATILASSPTLFDPTTYPELFI